MANRVYLDSSTIIAYLKGEEGHADTVEAALKIAQHGSDLALFTSSLTVVEVAYINELSKPLEENISLIDRFWQSAPIRIVEINRINANRARDLLRSRARNQQQDPWPKARNRAVDAMHLTAALILPCGEFWTYDTKDFRKYHVSEITVCEPHTDQLGLPFSSICSNLE